MWAGINSHHQLFFVLLLMASSPSVMADLNNNAAADKNCDGISKEISERPIWWDINNPSNPITTSSIEELFRDYFDCGAMLYGYADDDDIDQYSPTPVWTLRQWWSTMNDKYRKEVNLVPLYPDISQIVVPVHIGDAGEKKGRAIFATEQIKEGTLVKDLLNGSTAIFKDAHTWRKFVLSLPREMACNHLEWNWVQYIQPEKEDDIDLWEGLSVFIAFDESSLLNAGDWDKWRDDSNVRCGSPPMHEGGERGPCRFHYYASRDIAAGEELLIKYNDFEDESQEGWKYIGL